MLQPGQAVPVWFSALSVLVRGVGVPAVALQAKGNAVPLGSAQWKSERGPSPGCLRIPGWWRGRRQVIVQSKSVTAPALVVLVAELAANNPWGIPNRRNEGKKERARQSSRFRLLGQVRYNHRSLSLPHRLLPSPRPGWFVFIKGIP